MRPVEYAAFKAPDRNKIDTFWRLPGGDWIEGVPTAREVKAVGAKIRVAARSGLHKFDVSHKDNWGDERFPWRVSSVLVVGTNRPAESSICLDEFPSLRAALADARRRVNERDYREAA